jgi:hypothetical protein
MLEKRGQGGEWGEDSAQARFRYGFRNYLSICKRKPK